MDSFLSLFDPSDSQTRTSSKKRHKPEQDNVKKKVENPSKGRKRGRRSQVKNETLPEESSFLCEPDLSNEVLVKDGSYIESYFEVNRVEEETLDEDTRPKRRNSRKGRRRKNKVSPAKDLTPNFGWDDESDSVDSQGASLNNHFFKPKVADDQIGKNVNNLKNEGKERHRPKIGSFEEREVYNVIDKLEKVSLKDDVYLAGDFDAEDLENDFIYNSDEVEESFDDTASDASDSEEAYGSLPPEPRFGNVEYKLQLVAPCERRFQHLVTQLKWRLRSGGGCAVYVVGVRDCGALRGLRPRALRATLRTLAKMAAALAATVNHCSVRRVAPHRAVAEIYIRKLADAQQSVELRVAVMGANEAGKSTLIGVLTQGELDNGRGSARLNMFRHLHEVKSGRTSSLSHEILGFDAQGNVVNYGCSELMTAERIGERSARLVSFLDLAGHSKYQRTTVHGLTGYCPHYAMLVISATAGITPITEEHLGLVLALDLPLFVVITKAELSAAAVPPLVARLRTLLAPAGKKPLLISDEQSARSCVAPQPLILDAIDRAEGGEMHDPHSSVAVFPVSCVRGGGLRALHAGLLALSVPVPPASDGAGAGARTDEDADADDADGDADEERCEFQIDEIFHVGDSGGPVVGGLMVRGQLREGDRVVVGPLENGDFIPIVVKSIHRNRVPHGSVRAGQSASLGLCGSSRPRLRPGQAVLAAPGTRVGPRPVFASCGKHRHTAEFVNIVQGGQHHDNAKNRKNVRRKNKNLLQDLAKVENSLIKNNEIQPANFYKSDSESDKREMENANTRRKDSDGDTANDLDNSGLDSENNLRYKNRKNSAKDSRLYEDSIEDTNVKNIDTKLNNTTKDTTKYNTKDENLIVKKTNVNFEEKWSTIDKRKETQDANVYKSESDGGIVEKEAEDDVECTCHEMVPLEDPNDPRGCLYFQATMHVLRHPTAIKPGFQCTVHAGNVRQTAIIEGILSGSGSVLAGAAAAALFRFARCPEYLAPGRRLLLTAGLGTRAIGRVTQVFPYFP